MKSDGWTSERLGGLGLLQFRELDEPIGLERDDEVMIGIKTVPRQVGSLEMLS